VRHFYNVSTPNRFLLAAGLAVLGCGSMLGNVVQGTIIGVFSNPVLAGVVANDPSLGQNTYLDNTGTATYSINNSTDPTVGGTPPMQLTGSALNWGASAGNSGPTTFSTLAFFGAPIPANYTTPFQIGTLTFSNGTSDLTSLIFGATLSFYDNTVSPSSFLGSDQVIITTTSNLGVSVAQDADYVNICGNNSNICNMSIEAIEATEGGTGVTFDLMGTIVGDPTLDVTNVQTAPGQSATTNGFVGNAPPLGIAPEPGTLVMFPAALILGFGFLRLRRPTSR
jgi:hypothetical protein